MSSAVQTSLPVTGTTHRPRVDATYALETMRALAPAIDRLAAHVIHGSTPSSSVAAATQMFQIQEALADGLAAIKGSIPEQMLSAGGEHVFFVSTTQRPQGRWIKDTYTLLRGIENRIRDGLREQEEVASLCRELLSEDSPKALSLPRLMRACAKSSFFTGRYLNSAAHRAELGIVTDFSARQLRPYISNPTNVV